MKITSSNVYVGPNVYAHFPVIRHVVNLGILEEYPSVKLGTVFIEGLVAALPGLQQHGCSHDVAGGFIRRLKENEGTWVAHIWEHVILELQCMALFLKTGYWIILEVDNGGVSLQLFFWVFLCMLTPVELFLLSKHL